MAYPSEHLGLLPDNRQGAAAVILCNADRAAEFTDNPVFISGYGAASTTTWRFRTGNP